MEYHLKPSRIQDKLNRNRVASTGSVTVEDGCCLAEEGDFFQTR